MRSPTLLLSLLPLLASAQHGTASVSVRADTTTIRIGEQVHLQLALSLNPGTSVQWPVIRDTLTAHVEVVKDGGIDTLAVKDGSIRQVRELTVTSFDTGYWAVPPFTFVVNGIAHTTEPLLLTVQPVQLDSALTLRDIQDIHTLPFSILYWVREHIGWILAGAGTLVALIVGLWFLSRPKKTAGTAEPPAAQTPLHERILTALRALETERVWQQGEHKVYHSRLTDLLRSYIEERYRVPALESTTDELMKELRVSPLNNDQRNQLENMLRLADLVKFAKTLPSPQENEQMMAAAVHFVQSTVVTPSSADHA